MRRRTREHLMGRRHFLAFVAPSVLTMGALLVLPLGYTLVWSFQNVSYGGHGKWVGLRNYTTSLASSRFRSDVVFTVGFTVVVTALLLVVGYAMALLLFAVSRRLRPVFLGLLLVPYVVPVVVGALAFSWMFNDAYGGPMAGVLRSLGLHYQWLNDRWPAHVLLVLNTIWSQAAFPTLILLAGLHTVEAEQLEAAMIDGAGWVQRQRYIVLPRLSRLIGLITLISVMDNLRVFDQVKMITPSAQTLGTESIMVYVYDVALGDSQQLGLASAVSVMTMLLTFVMIIPLLRQTYREVKQR
jgi:N,N'-diacetylchitobiose transport system permease protein